MERYRIVADVGLYYVTFAVVEWLPVFIEETACRIVTESLNFCVQKKRLGVNAYVIMPTHLHAIVFDVEFNSERLKHTLDDMRQFTGRQLLDYASKHLPKSFTEEFRKRAGKDRERRFWQPTQPPIGIFSEGFWKAEKTGDNRLKASINANSSQANISVSGKISGCIDCFNSSRPHYRSTTGFHLFASSNFGCYE